MRAFDANDHRPHYAAVSDEVRELRTKARMEHLRTLSDAWRQSDADSGEADPAAAVVQPEVPRSPAARRALAYETRKRELSEAWLAPRRVLSPWEQPTRSPMYPEYWNTGPVDPVTTVTEPAATNPRKGAGVSLTPEEIEARRAAERAAFSELLSRAWTSRLYHL